MEGRRGNGVRHAAAEISPGLLADGQRLYVVTHKGSDMRPKDTLHALALSTGQEKWSQSLGGYVGIAMIHEELFMQVEIISMRSMQPPARSCGPSRIRGVRLPG